MADPYTGEIRLLPFTFAPYGWLDCAGQLVSIQQYTVLYSIIGTQYGGNGSSTFGLPDLRGRAGPGFGDDPTDSFDPAIGSTGGVEQVALIPANIPQHTHSLYGATQPAAARTNVPSTNYIGQMVYRTLPSGPTIGTNCFFDNSTVAPTLAAMNANSLPPYPGQGLGHENRQPYLAMRYCICFDGNYPARP